jgi:tRNA pseudouridine55 synthase
MDKLGILLINKPVGITSFDIIRRLRRITNIKQIGHAGTLDPFAEGLMQILVGKATKFAQYLTNYDKSYQVTMQFGIKTDTGDTSGEIIKESMIEDLIIDPILLKEQVEALTEQVPPIYSAIKVNGQRAYKLARKKADIAMKARPIKVRDFLLIDYSFPFLTYKCKVSKGTYIRSLTEQIADMYSTIATTIKLDRLSVSDSQLSDAVNLDDLTAENWFEYLLPVDRFIEWPVIQLNQAEVDDFWYGREIKLPKQADAELVIVKHNQETRGIGRVVNSVLQPKKVFK